MAVDSFESRLKLPNVVIAAAVIGSGVAVALAAGLLFVRPYAIPTGSMENTFLIGDHVLARVFPRPTPKRGDVIVFRSPVDAKQLSVKRVIGIAGDRLHMIDRVVYLNGLPLAEPYVTRRFPSDPFRDNLPGPVNEIALRSMPRLFSARADMLEHHVVNGEVVIPPGRYFVLGDNRDNSLDSRYWGFVDESEVVGEPFLVYISKAGPRGVS